MKKKEVINVNEFLEYYLEETGRLKK